MRRIIPWLIVMTVCGSAPAFAQMSGTIELKIDRIGTGWKAGATISLTGQRLSTDVRDLNAAGTGIRFNVSALEAELRFAGTLAGNRLEGNIEGFQKGVRIAVGEWKLTRRSRPPRSRSLAGRWVGVFELRSTGNVGAEQPASDVGFNAAVAVPAYTAGHPKVLFDEAHNNADTSAGRYKPFVDLITNDGYIVAPNKQRLSKESLDGANVLVIVNASGPPEKRDAPAFAPVECDTVRDWVKGGGALLLITDHAPFSSAVSELAMRFGVDLTIGYTIDRSKHNTESGDETELLFTREDGLLGDHPIMRGRDAGERINRIVTFTGTSVDGPMRSTQLLKVAASAVDVLPPERKPASPDEPQPEHRQVPAAGRAQAIAFSYGDGRVVILAEAAMFTAQVASRGFRFGMNVPGLDNRQMALNTMHWLSGLLK
jgi:hypothetical protein